MSLLRPAASSIGRRSLLAATLFAAALPAGASAHIPGVGHGLQPTGNGPNLRSVTVQTTSASNVQFCFDKTVTTSGANPAQFRVRSYDATQYWTGTSIQPDQSSTSCVVVGYDYSVLQGTVGEVDPGAITTLTSIPNMPASEPLTNSAVQPRPGETSAPDLISVTRQGSNALIFTYDEPIANVTDSATSRASFAAETQQANALLHPITVASVPVDTASSLTQIKATFSPSDAQDIVLGISYDGAVTDRGHSVGGAAPSPAGELALTGQQIGDAGGGLAPVSAELYGKQYVEIDYSRPVRVSPTGSPEFYLYSDTGQMLASGANKGDTFLSSDSKSVFVNFGSDFGNDLSGWVQVTVSPLAVQTTDGNTIGAGLTLPLKQPNMSPGYTGGPDLLSASIDSNNTITYTFDEEVNQSPSASAASSLFGLLPLANYSVPGDKVTGLPVRANPTQITVPASTMSLSTGAGIIGYDVNSSADTIEDTDGNPAPTGSVSYQVEQPPATPVPTPVATPVATPAPPAPVAGSTTLTRKLLKKTKKKKFVVKYSGRVASPVAACVAKRVGTFVAKRKNGDIKTLGSAVSNSKGAFALALKKRPKGKITVTFAPNPAANCGAFAGGGINA